MELILANWKLILIAALTALVVFFHQLWMGSEKDLATERAAAAQAAADAITRAKEIKAHYQEIVKDVSLSWDAALPGVRAAAVENYARRFGTACLRPNGDGLRLNLSATGHDVPGTAEGAEVPLQEEPERLATEHDAFIRACAEDAQARELTREWALRVGIKPED